MSVINPKRVLTEVGQRAFLNMLTAEESDGPLVGVNCRLVTAAEVASDDKTLSSMTLGTQGMGTATPLVFGVSVAESATGKTYFCSDLMVFTATSGVVPQDLVGIVVGGAGTVDGVLAYLQFDDPIGIDELSEVVQVAVEFGFDGLEFYTMPRVFPAGV